MSLRVVKFALTQNHLDARQSKTNANNSCKSKYSLEEIYWVHQWCHCDEWFQIHLSLCMYPWMLMNVCHWDESICWLKICLCLARQECLANNETYIQIVEVKCNVESWPVACERKVERPVALESVTRIWWINCGDWCQWNRRDEKRRQVYTWNLIVVITCVSRRWPCHLKAQNTPQFLSHNFTGSRRNIFSLDSRYEQAINIDTCTISLAFGISHSPSVFSLLKFLFSHRLSQLMSQHLLFVL